MLKQLASMQDDEEVKEGGVPLVPIIAAAIPVVLPLVVKGIKAFIRLFKKKGKGGRMFAELPNGQIFPVKIEVEGQGLKPLTSSMLTGGGLKPLTSSNLTGGALLPAGSRRAGALLPAGSRRGAASHLGGTSDLPDVEPPLPFQALSGDTTSPISGTFELSDAQIKTTKKIFLPDPKDIEFSEEFSGGRGESLPDVKVLIGGIIPLNM